ncbi:MAG: ferric reductase-like transmembrane domain-containing protein, partial [Chloroflexi bacterium]|nr:ferric reductase-like transmembrane domain-containing protein [Chloroflexota bacterium]
MTSQTTAMDTPGMAGPATATTSTATRATTTARRVPHPRTWPVRAGDILALLLGNAILIVLMWVRHGGLEQLSTPAGVVTAAGQLTALLGTYLVLVELVLASRSPFLDQVFGMDRVYAAHRWTGFAATWLIVGHAVLSTVGWSMGDGSSPLEEAWTLLTAYPFVLWAAVGLALFILLAVSSVRAARRRISYEGWFSIHLYAYLAVALAFAHQLLVGSDFVNDPVARLYWIGLYAVAAGLILVFRFGAPIALSLRHRLRVARVEREGPGVVSVYITGRDLDRLAVRAGQWFQWRFLRRDGWWRAHPFSLSAVPNGQFLRLTIKDLGDDSHRFQDLPVGTPVFVEGPYGILTGARRTRPRVLLDAGGVGIAPLRALFAGLAAGPGDLTLVYRASRPQDVVFRAELDRLAAARGATVHYLVGKRGTPDMPADPLAPEPLGALVPDVSDRDVFVCGPVPMMDRVEKSLRA